MLFIAIMSVMTGERVNFIIISCAIVLAALASRPNISRFFAVMAINAMTIFTLFFFSPSSAFRSVERFIGDHHSGQKPLFARVWNGAIDAFQSSVWTGVGPDNYRTLLSNFS